MVLGHSIVTDMVRGGVARGISATDLPALGKVYRYVNLCAPHKNFPLTTYYRVLSCRPPSSRLKVQNALPPPLSSQTLANSTRALHVSHRAPSLLVSYWSDAEHRNRPRGFRFSRYQRTHKSEDGTSRYRKRYPLIINPKVPNQELPNVQRQTDFRGCRSAPRR